MRIQINRYQNSSFNGFIVCFTIWLSTVFCVFVMKLIVSLVIQFAILNGRYNGKACLVYLIFTIAVSTAFFPHSPNVIKISTICEYILVILLNDMTDISR